MQIENSQREIMLEKISATPSRESLLNFISWLDYECAEADETSISHQILARALIAGGYKLIDEKGKIETVIQTIRRAETYALNPTEQNWDSLFFDATQSFPFGPGDGCLSVKELIKDSHCGVGTGCRSGAGSLAHLDLDDSELMQTIASELIPWIMGNDDPIISRSQHL